MRGVALRGWLRSHLVAVCLTSLLTVGACLRITSFIGHGYGGGDDAAYADLAHSIVTGGFLRAHEGAAPIYPVRIGIVAPAAASFKLFGVSESALAVYPFLVSLAGILVAFIAGRMFFGERVGFLAAVLQAFLPVDVRYATLLYPDPPGALWLNAAILLVYLSSREPIVRKKTVYSAVAGLCLGLSWLCKEAVLFSLPFIGGYVLWSIYKDKTNTLLAGAMGVAFGAVLGVESGLYAWYLSDPLYHFHAIERHSRHPLAIPWFWRSDASWSELLARLLRDGPETILLNTRFGLVTALAALAVCYAVFKGMWSYAFVGAWFSYHVLVFNFGSHSLRSYMPLPMYDRYLWTLLLPAVLLTAAFVDEVWRSGKTAAAGWREADNMFWAGMLAAVLALGFVHGIYRNFKDQPTFEVEKVLSRLLTPETPVFSDGITLSRLRFFWTYPERTHSVEFGGLQARDIPHGAYVLVNPKRAEILLQLGWKPPEFFYRDVPTVWVPTWESPPARLYRVPDY
jgi:hypothetical protein